MSVWLWNFKDGGSHGLWTPRVSIFFPKLQIGPKILGPFWVFSFNLSAAILVLWFLCPCFQLVNHYFHIELSPKTYFGLGFEFGPQRIGNEPSVVRSPWLELKNKIFGHKYTKEIMVFLYNECKFAKNWQNCTFKVDILHLKSIFLNFLYIKSIFDELSFIVVTNYNASFE